MKGRQRSAKEEGLNTAMPDRQRSRRRLWILRCRVDRGEGEGSLGTTVGIGVFETGCTRYWGFKAGYGRHSFGIARSRPVSCDRLIPTIADY